VPSGPGPSLGICTPLYCGCILLYRHRALMEDSRRVAPASRTATTAQEVSVSGTYATWLGEAAGQMNSAQRERFDAAADAYYALPLHQQRDPQDSDAHRTEDDAALTAILRSVLWEDSIEGAAARVRQAQIELDGWVRASAALGVSEARIAERSGLH